MKHVNLGSVVASILALALSGCGGGSSDGGDGTYTLSGQVTFDASGLEGVTMAFGDGTSVTTDASGSWSKAGLSGTSSVTPALAGYSFAPAAITASAARSDVDFTAARITVAYVYGDAAAADAFEAMLDPVYPTDRILKADIATADFGKYSLIVLGRGGSALDAGQVATIQATGLPVIGISGGGLDYFGKIGLSMNGGNVASSHDATQAIVIDAALPVWSFPNALDTGTGVITVFGSASQASVLYKPYLGASGVHIAGLDVSYDTIAQEGINLYWAYYEDASHLTEAGGQLFVNLVQYMAM
jgi:hypothetical protein